MPLDLTKLSDEDLLALQAGDLTKVSDRVLSQIQTTYLEEERGARTVQTPTSAFSNVRPEISGATFQPPEETMAQGVRYGLPIAAGLATGGVGVVPAAIGGLTSGASEALAQMMEMDAGVRSEVNKTDILASGVGGIAPIFSFKAAPQAAEVFLGPAAKSFLATFTGQLAASEGSRYIKNGEFIGLTSSKENIGGMAKEAVLRWGLPVGVSVLAGKVPQLEKAAEDIAAIEKEGRRAIVMDVRPELAELEARNFRAGAKLATSIAADMDKDLPAILKASFGDMSPQSQTEIAQMIAPYRTVFEDAKANLAKATQLAESANAELKAAEATRSANLSTIKAAAQIATEQRLLAENAVSEIAGKLFGRNNGVLTSDVAIGALQKRMKAVAASAEAGVESGLDALYANSGLRPNDVVVTKADVLRSINARKSAGRPLEGDVARSNAERAVELFFGEGDSATLEQLRKFKEVIAQNLPQGSPADAAGRYAGALYDALKQSSYKYIGKNYSEETFNAFKVAQSRAAANFSSREGSAVEMLKNGDFAGFYKAAKEEGRLGNMMSELDAYANSLSRLTSSAVKSGQVWRASDISSINLARQFKSDVNQILVNGIVNDSIIGRTAGINKVVDVVDPKKLIETLGYFESQGFTMRQLGLDSQAVGKLIKANAMAGKEPITVGKLTDFLELLPSTGADTAAARIAYRQSVADAMIAKGAKEQNVALQKAKRIADGANLDEAARRAEFNVAIQDPVVNFFKENGSMLIGNGALQNSDWVNAIITKDPETIKGFIAAINSPASGLVYQPVMSKLREATIAYAVKRFTPDVAGTGAKLDAGQIIAPFVSNNRDMQMVRANMQTILGKEGYDKMVGLIVEPLRKVAVNRIALGQDLYNLTDDIKGILSAQALASGKATAGVIAANAAKNTANLVEKMSYGVLAGIWLNPEFSSSLAKAGYDLNRFAGISERNRLALEIAMREDEKQRQAYLQQNPPANR